MELDKIIEEGNRIKENATFDSAKERYSVDGEALEKFAYHAYNYFYEESENQFFLTKVQEYSSDLTTKRYEKLEGILGTLKGEKEKV